MIKRSHSLAILFCLAAISVPREVQAQAAPDLGNDPYEWDHAFPIWGKKVADKGIQLPLPWGAGFNYSYVDQPINIESIELAVGESEFVDVTDMLVFDEVRSRVHVLNARLDLWLFPFLNVYGLGLFAPQTKTDVVISEPFALNAGGNQSGVGAGFGMTAAFGLGGFFGLVDMNWTWNKMQNLNEPVRTFILTPRFGRNFGKVGPVRLVGWVGAMRQKIGAETNGSINLSDAVEGGQGFQGKVDDWYNGLPPLRQAIVRGIAGRIGQDGDTVIHYKLDKQVKYKWNMTLGGEVGINERLQLRAEIGFLGRTQVIAGFNYRFGIFSAAKEKQEKKPDITPAPATPAEDSTTAKVAL